MARILKNNSTSPIVIADINVTIPATSQRVVIGAEFPTFKSSVDLLILVKEGSLIVNNGFQDLSITDGLWYMFDLAAVATQLRDPYNMQVNEGLVHNVRARTVIGYTNKLDTNWVPIWTHPEDVPFISPTTNETYEIVSDSTEDAPGQTGTAAVFMESLDENGLIQNTLITLNGTTPVTVSGLHSFPRSVVGVAAGSEGMNVGNISITAQGSGNLRLYMPAGEGSSFSAIYKIPADCYFHIQALDYHNGTIDKRLGIRSRIKLDGTTHWVSTSILPFGPVSFQAKFDVSARFPPLTEVRFDSKVSSGSGDEVALILAGFEKIIKD